MKRGIIRTTAPEHGFAMPPADEVLHGASEDITFIKKLLRQLSINALQGSSHSENCIQEDQSYLRTMTLIRRALRDPLFRNNEGDFPPNAIALCAVAHVSGIDVCTVHRIYEDIQFVGSPLDPPCAKNILQLNDIQRINDTAWLPFLSSESSLATPASKKRFCTGMENTNVPPELRRDDVRNIVSTETPKQLGVEGKKVNCKQKISGLKDITCSDDTLKAQTTPVTPKIKRVMMLQNDLNATGVPSSSQGKQNAPEIPEIPDNAVDETGPFAPMHVILVTSPRFSARAAGLMKTGVELQNGKAELVSAENASPQALANLSKSAHPRNTIVVADATFLTRHIKLYGSQGKSPGAISAVDRCYDVLPHKWLADSLRAKRIKARDMYTKTPPPKPVTIARSTSICTFGTPQAIKANIGVQVDVTQSTPRFKRMKDLQAEANFSEQKSPPPSKRTKVITHTTSSLAIRLFDVPRNIQKVEEHARGTGDCTGDSVRGKIAEPGKEKGPRWACEVRVGRSTANFEEFPNNARICEQLEIVLTSYRTRRDTFRIIGYQKAISRIKALNFDVESMDDVERLRKETNVGERIAEKVQEIVKTGTLRQAQEVLANSDLTALQDLCGVWGVGPVKALTLLARGIRNIADLRQAASEDVGLLDRCQTIGMRLYEDLLERLPRTYVAELEMYVRKIVRGIDEKLDIVVAGSYIRGKSFCGDVDILIHGDARRLRNAFGKVKQAMRTSGVLTDDLVDGDGKYFGVFRLPGRKHGRIDLFAVPQEEFPYALLTYTGSAVFNRSMRAKAKSLGYSLSHHGLQRVNRNITGKTRVEPSIVVNHEKDIFRLLDVPYVPPNQRSIS